MNDYHTPALLQASIDGLNIQGDGVYVDLTFGGGGHSREILKRLSEKGKLVAFDTDEDAAANIPDDSRIVFVQSNFRYFIQFLEFKKLIPVQGIIADLGMSSHHIDTPERGFSYRYSGNLDMRMNKHSEKTAADILNTYPVKELFRIFEDFGELGGNARKIAEQVEAQRKHAPFKLTTDLNEAVKKALNGYQSNRVLSKVYQALRIEVNEELEVLKDMLMALPDALDAGGRACVITYHSLEDRLVKTFFKQNQIAGRTVSGNNQLSPVNKKVIIPDFNEVKQNKRIRSAKLRIAEKI